MVAGGLVDILHAGVVVATHAQRLRGDQADRRPRARVARRARDATKGLTVTRLADSAGTVCFAGTNYAAGRRWARQPIDVVIVAESVQLSRDGKVIRTHRGAAGPSAALFCRGEAARHPLTLAILPCQAHREEVTFRLAVQAANGG